jgi:hypothetical protein
MDIPWLYELKSGQLDCPIVHARRVKLPDSVPVPTEDELLTVFKTDGFKLQTWARTVGEDGKIVKENDPHWIAVRGQTPLHLDPSYPRYSHHLKVRVDPGISARGLNKVELPLARGTFYVLDTHSPHQVMSKSKTAWNVAVSIDSSEKLDFDEAFQRCLNYAMTHTVLDE